MEILLNDTQAALLKQKEASVRYAQMELKHVQDKMDSFITGIATTKNVMGQFTYQVVENKLLIEFPEVKPPAEE